MKTKQTTKKKKKSLTAAGAEDAATRAKRLKWYYRAHDFWRKEFERTGDDQSLSWTKQIQDAYLKLMPR